MVPRHFKRDQLIVQQAEAVYVGPFIDTGKAVLKNLEKRHHFVYDSAGEKENMCRCDLCTEYIHSFIKQPQVIG